MSQPTQRMNIDTVKRLAAERNLSGDILNRLDAIGTKPPAQKNAAQEQSSGAKATGGIKLQVRIMKFEQKRGKKMPYTDYELMICRSFGTMRIPPNEGELASENELKLRIHSTRIMSADEIRVHTAECAANNITDRYELDLTKELDYLENAVETLVPGRVLKVRWFGTAFKKMGDLAFAVGDCVFIRNLYAEWELDTFEEINKNPTEEQKAAGVRVYIKNYNGTTKQIMATEEEKAQGLTEIITRTISHNKYGVKFYAKGMRLDNTAELQSDEDIWMNLAKHNKILKLRPEANYGEENQTEEERKFEVNLGARNNFLDRWKVVHSKVPQAVRGLIQAPLVLELYRPDDGVQPEQLVDEYALVLQNPQWTSMFMDSKLNPDKTTDRWKVGDFKVDADIFRDGGVEEKARIFVEIHPTELHRKDDQELMDEYGCSNALRFANIGPVYVPLCSGIGVFKLDLVGTAYMVENDVEMNPKGSDGQYLEGVAFGACYKSQILAPNVASGVARGGFLINRKCAEAAFAVAFNGAAPSREHPPELVSSYTGRNKLNRKHTTDVINTFESPCSFEALENENWVFYFVCKTSKQTDVSQHYLKEIRDSVGGDPVRTTQIVSEVIEDKNTHKVFYGFPAGLAAPVTELDFCVFAVKRNVSDEYEKPVVKRTEEEFLDAVMDLYEKRHATTEAETPQPKRQKVEADPEPVTQPEPVPVTQPEPVPDLNQSLVADPLSFMEDD